MQDLVEELIRGIGYFALRLVTFGRYRGGGETDRLFEGALGFGIVGVAAYGIYTLQAN
jgi:hypothetical protein